MKTSVVSMAAVRRLAVERQLLGDQRPGTGVDGILDVARRLRVLQVDPISVVAPSHQLVLWSRLGNYSLANLDEILWHQRALFSYWAHEASLVLTEDYPLHRLGMVPYRSRPRPRDQEIADWLDRHAALRRRILGEIRRLGPRRSREIDPQSTTGWSASGWSGERNVARMLELLWRQGEITIAARSGKERVWDISRRWMPPQTPRGRVSRARAAALSVEYATRALGVARFKEIRAHFICRFFPETTAVMESMLRRRVLRTVAVTGDDGSATPEPWYVHAADVERLLELDHVSPAGRTTLLSPFDNLIRDRDRTESVWGFRYRTQFYVPRAQRDHGFYVMPVLHGEKLVARVDPRFDRARGTLVVEAVREEPGVDPGWAAALAPALRDLSAFLGGSGVELGAGIYRSADHAADLVG